MRKEFFTLALILLVGCNNSNATKELAIRFRENIPVLDSLREMSTQDASVDSCFIVGPERIGDYFNRNGSWIYLAEYNKSFELTAVLDATGLQRQRYDQYVTKLALLSAEKVTYCKGSHSGAEFSVLVSSSGFCDRTINWSTAIPQVKAEQRGGDYHDVAPLANGWYVEVRCS